MKFNQSFFLLLVFLFIVNWNCSEVLATDSTRYRVLKGEIICNEPQWLVYTYIGHKRVDVDSIFLKKGSNYIKFKGLEASKWDEDLYLLTFRKTIGQLWLFYSDDTINVNIDMTTPSYLMTDIRKMVFGSPATIESYDQEKVLVSIARERIALKDERDSLLFYNTESSRINDINKKIDSLLNIRENYYIKSVLNSQYSCNSAIALIFLTSNKNDLNPYIWLSDSVQRRFPKSWWIKEVVGDIKNRAKMHNKVATSGASSNFQLKDVGNKIVKLLAYRGSYILLDFWASWCTPCINEMPHTIEIQKKYADKGLKVITISIDKNKEAWLKAVEKYHMQSLINLLDEKKEVAKAYKVSYVPLTVLINPDGEIVGSNLRGKELEKKLEQVLKNQ